MGVGGANHTTVLGWKEEKAIHDSIAMHQVLIKMKQLKFLSRINVIKISSNERTSLNISSSVRFSGHYN